MGTASNLATIDEMETLWYELQREMTESGKVTKFPAPSSSTTAKSCRPRSSASAPST
jgi:hypothetical protein